MKNIILLKMTSSSELRKLPDVDVENLLKKSWINYKTKNVESKTKEVK